MHERIGEINTNSYGSKMTIIEYNGAIDIVVEFENGYKKKSVYSSFKNGLIRSPYDKTVCNTGYLGDGDYKAMEGKTKTIAYKRWVKMFQRCHSTQYKVNKPTYDGCTICEEWHNFQNFAEWFYENYYEVWGESMELDKDILVKGNKMYSPETCVFTPAKINTLFVMKNNKRTELPIGVTKSSTHRYKASSSKNGKRVVIGYYNTPEKAFEAFKQFRESYIKEIAESYMGEIPLTLYKAMMNYKIEITD